MKSRYAIGLVFAALVACGTEDASDAEDASGTDVRTVQPGAPGEASRVLTVEEAASLEHVTHTPADVRFMQGMIPHHAQALEMAALIPERTDHEGLRLLGRRIEISQRDEIGWMTRWLENRGETAPMMGAGHAHGLGEGELMPGMLSQEEMAALEAARGADFDRLFLEGMIRHHQGALIMVAELFTSPGGGQETEIFRFAADVDADQDMEILRMQEMLNRIP
ncbi:DUF305 domain-containing protein [Candidatus Palauibacter sp.]|uniref:DUF305 domain-containing protein n=1 Tax=Candidatus Palauibacter sp. TaxID=3101350 RepID=UPI003B026E4B